MVAPTGEPATTEIKSPARVHTMEKQAEQMVTPRKLLNTRMADKAGKITKAEINSEPTRFMASTTITAITTAISRL